MADVVHGPTPTWATTPPGRVTRPVSWGAIFAGAVLVTVIQMMLGLLGLAIGLATVDPEKEHQFAGLGVAGFVWWLVSGIIALFIGGWAAARLAGAHRRTNGALHGLVVWGLATLFMAFLLTTTAGAVMGGAFNLLDRTVVCGPRAVTGMGAGGTADGRTADGGTANGRTADGGTTGRTADGGTANRERTGGRTADGGTADRGAQSLQETREQAGETAQKWGGKVADWSAAASFWAFVMLLAGAVAAAFGGGLGIWRTDRFGHDEPVTPPRA